MKAFIHVAMSLCLELQPPPSDRKYQGRKNQQAPIRTFTINNVLLRIMPLAECQHPYPT